jgi:hypothetical protein
MCFAPSRRSGERPIDALHAHALPASDPLIATELVRLDEAKSAIRETMGKLLGARILLDVQVRRTADD